MKNKVLLIYFLIPVVLFTLVGCKKKLENDSVTIVSTEESFFPDSDEYVKKEYKNDQEPKSKMEIDGKEYILKYTMKEEGTDKKIGYYVEK